jgi:hypothetical protein
VTRELAQVASLKWARWSLSKALHHLQPPGPDRPDRSTAARRRWQVRVYAGRDLPAGLVGVLSK